MRPAYPIAYRDEIVETQGRLFGQFYAYYQWQTGERSRDIVRRIPMRVMRAAYPGLHDLDLGLAVERMENVV